MKFLFLSLLLGLLSCASYQESGVRKVANSSVLSGAQDVLLFAFINVESSRSSSTTTDGDTSFSSYNWENSYVIGWNESTRRQVVAKAGGCGKILNRKTAILYVSDKSSEYAGIFSKTTYKKAVSSTAECKSLKNRLKEAQYDNPISIVLNNSDKTFSIR